jgi:hypothetical protein
MKSLFLLVLCALCGVLATVLFFTIDPTFDSSEADGAGGGNVTLSLSEEALAALIAEGLRSNDPAAVAPRTAALRKKFQGLHYMNP